MGREDDGRLEFGRNRIDRDRAVLIAVVHDGTRPATHALRTRGTVAFGLLLCHSTRDDPRPTAAVDVELVPVPVLLEVRGEEATLRFGEAGAVAAVESVCEGHLRRVHTRGPEHRQSAPGQCPRAAPRYRPEPFRARTNAPHE